MGRTHSKEGRCTKWFNVFAVLPCANSSVRDPQDSRENYETPSLSDLEDQNAASEESMATGEIERILEGKESESISPYLSSHISGWPLNYTYAKQTQSSSAEDQRAYLRLELLPKCLQFISNWCNILQKELEHSSEKK